MGNDHTSRKGQLVLEGDTATLIFRRVLRHAPAHVWDAIATPEGLKEWLMKPPVALGVRRAYQIERSADEAEALRRLCIVRVDGGKISITHPSYSAGGRQFASCGDPDRAAGGGEPALLGADPGRALVGLSARADLVVVGRHARHPGLPGAGSVRHAVLNHAHGPVATVPSV